MAGFPGKLAIHGRFYVCHLAGNYECAFILGTKQPNMCCCLMVIANLWDWHGLATSGHFEFSYSANQVVQVFFFYVAGINIYETRINWHGNPAFNHRLRTNFMTIPLVQRFLSNVTTHFFLEHRELRKAGRKPSTVVHPRSQLDNGLQEQLELVVNHLLTWDVLPSRERHIQTALFGPLFFCFPDDSGCKKYGSQFCCHFHHSTPSSQSHPIPFFATSP